MNNTATYLSLALAAALLSGCNDERPKNDGKVLNEQVIEGEGSTKVMGEIWVDNWFSLAVNGKPLIEDSVAYNTERSFNAERVTFSADLPMTLAFEMRDFKENDTGLEYIGTDRQQMGDGGMIAQFRDTASDTIIGASDGTMRCLVIHRAPLDDACAKEESPVAGEGACQFTATEAPANWTAPDFDDSSWPMAVEHSASDVGPKEGYDAITWDQTAKLVWSEDLVRDNTLLCRMTVSG
ncbi:PEBP family protein [Rhizobiaceae bacterium]|nr:PEBP family protein [Rhizobiaceae bacterium]